MSDIILTTVRWALTVCHVLYIIMSFNPATTQYVGAVRVSIAQMQKLRLRLMRGTCNQQRDSWDLCPILSYFRAGHTAALVSNLAHCLFLEIRFDWNTAMLIPFSILLMTTFALPRLGWVRDHMARDENIYYLALHSESLQHLSKPSSSGASTWHGASSSGASFHFSNGPWFRFHSNPEGQEYPLLLFQI